jgi:hypothetical protein
LIDFGEIFFTEILPRTLAETHPKAAFAGGVGLV